MCNTDINGSDILALKIQIHGVFQGVIWNSANRSKHAESVNSSKRLVSTSGIYNSGRLWIASLAVPPPIDTTSPYSLEVLSAMKGPSRRSVVLQIIYCFCVSPFSCFKFHANNLSRSWNPINARPGNGYLGMRLRLTRRRWSQVQGLRRGNFSYPWWN